MELTMLGGALPRFRMTSANGRAPFYIVMWCGLCASILMIMVVACTTLAKGDMRLDNFSSAYAHLLPGLPLNSAQAHEFSCFHRAIPYPNDVSAECVLLPQTGPFSHVNIKIWDGVITTLIFTAQENTVRLGDLSLLWGRPEFELRGSLIKLKWPDYGVAASAQAHSRYLTYFSPISQVWFWP